MTNPNHPVNTVTSENILTGIMSDSDYVGLTKREYFAARAMQGLLTNYIANGHYGSHESFPMVEEHAVSCADRLIIELNKGKEEKP